MTKDAVMADSRKVGGTSGKWRAIRVFPNSSSHRSPHPEERILATLLRRQYPRLEGWLQSADPRPSFETPRQQARLLRMRTSMDWRPKGQIQHRLVSWSQCPYAVAMIGA